MRRGVRSPGGGSVELLLDTMCNAFGGVMFIAILLVILSQFAEIAPADPGERVVELQRREMRLAAEVGDLRAELRRSREHLHSLRALRENLPVFEKLRSLRAETAEVQEELERREEELAQAVEHAEAAADELADARDEAAELDERIEALLDAVAKQEGEPPRALRIPRIRMLRKAPFWTIVRNDRLYLLYLPSRLQVARRVNEDDVRHRRYGDYVEFEARPGRGIDLTGDWKSHPLTRQFLENVSPGEYIAYFAVYPDSYEAFRELRDFVVDQGYDYFWSVQRDMDSRLRLQEVTERWFEGM